MLGSISVKEGASPDWMMRPFTVPAFHFLLERLLHHQIYASQ
jgi:hypothetical protein